MYMKFSNYTPTDKNFFQNSIGEKSKRKYIKKEAAGLLGQPLVCSFLQ